MRLLFLFLVFLPQLVLAQVLFFEGDYEQLKQKAKAEQRVYFIDMYTSWCGYCKKMDATTFQNQQLGDYVTTKFIAYKLNAEQLPGKELATKHGVSGYPTVLVFDHEGKLIDKIVGFKDASSFKLALQKHEAKSNVKITDNSAFEEYLNYQREDMKKLENKIVDNPLDQFSSLKQKAMVFGGANQRFDFEEFQFDINRKYGQEKADEMELYYQLGKGDGEEIKHQINNLKGKSFFGEELQAYFIRYFSVDTKPEIEQLKWVNELILKNKSVDLLELKIFVQYQFGDTEDAKDTLKELEKKNGKNESSRIRLLSEFVR